MDTDDEEPMFVTPRKVLIPRPMLVMPDKTDKSGDTKVNQTAKFLARHKEKWENVLPLIPEGLEPSFSLTTSLVRPQLASKVDAPNL